jgi:hypothetical protein
MSLRLNCNPEIKNKNLTSYKTLMKPTTADFLLLSCVKPLNDTWSGQILTPVQSSVLAGNSLHSE